MSVRRRATTGGVVRAALLLVGLTLTAAACTSAASGAGTSSSEVATPAPATARTTSSTSAATRPAASGPPSTAPATTTTVAPTTTRPTTTPYVVPVAAGVRISYSRDHHDYPASDIFATTGCGTPIVSPVNGRIVHVRRVDEWSAGDDDPAGRGGKSVGILGDDGVRYYLAHFQAIDDGIEPGVEISAGQRLGEMGRTGRASACHVHFGISPPCPGPEWSVRRGVIWPWQYLDAWRAGEQRSPALEIYAWSTEHPDACAVAEAEPEAPASG